jgi:hypothetical protein
MGRVNTIPRPAEWLCYVCRKDLAERFGRTREFERRGERHPVCGRCISRYAAAVWQASLFGRRYRFVERHELPALSEIEPHNFPRSRHLAGPSLKTQIFLLLVFALERQVREGRTAPREEVNQMAADITRNVAKFVERVATIVGKTFAVRGDDAKLDDSEALIRIRDLLDEIDPKIIERTKNKKLP